MTSPPPSDSSPAQQPEGSRSSAPPPAPHSPYPPYTTFSAYSPYPPSSPFNTTPQYPPHPGLTRNPSSASHSAVRRAYEPFLDFDRFFDADSDTPTAEEGPVRVLRATSPVDEAEARAARNLALSAFKPRMDLHEDIQANTVTVLFELPGVRRADVRVQVDVTAGRLTIAAEHHLPDELEEAGYAVREIRYGHFMRSVALPRGVEVNDITASLCDGILRLKYPRVLPAAQGRSAQGGGGGF